MKRAHTHPYREGQQKALGQGSGKSRAWEAEKGLARNRQGL